MMMMTVFRLWRYPGEHMLPPLRRACYIQPMSVKLGTIHSDLSPRRHNTKRQSRAGYPDNDKRGAVWPSRRRGTLLLSAKEIMTQ